uniref:Twin-arginine translocation signal domain-containing protein n=1 Tax=Acinetobacter phage vB_Ab_1137_KEN_01 TaxID=3143009 RepID=A0AAU8KTP0_9VIRU
MAKSSRRRHIYGVAGATVTALVPSGKPLAIE